jgi:TolB-like protein/DNA-binding winged helix-turn-helix (wHTH) protein/Tfp pilus assembly protein PilF
MQNWREPAMRPSLEHMIYRFGPFELDLAAVELRAHGKIASIEPQVFALLALLIENYDRLVSKDEIIEKVWDGRIVSDAAVASRVKSARRALGDDGRTQRFIRTVHGQGFRFVAEINAFRGSAGHCGQQGGPNPGSSDIGSLAHQLERVSRPSIAVLPFRMFGAHERYPALASALPDELISELARLRWLRVTARGSSFRVRAHREFSEIGRLLGVRYCLSGAIEVSDRRLLIIVELVDTLDSGVVWADRFSGRIDDVHSIRDEIRSRVLIALDIQIPIHEANLARLAGSDDLDAWSAYHLGLQHTYRFNRTDNAVAAQLFQRAITLDPRFARAHAGLSFVHFQTAFMHYASDIDNQIRQARQFAEYGLSLDPLDPFVNFTMGRSFWLDGDLESSSSWLERATSISPNYAQGIYARAWTEALNGRPAEARKHIDLAMRLSPIDPLYYAMLATRAFTHMVKGEDAEAADWAERGARAPGAHVLIAMVAAAAQSLSGNLERARWWAANVRVRNASLGREDFFRAFPMKSDPTRTRVMRALMQVGL